MSIETVTAKRSRRPDIAPIKRERVVEEALALLREGGLKNLSTRRLAARLGVKSPALYWHVKDKSELADLVVEAMFATMRPAAPGPYLDRLRRIADEVRRALSAYRDAPLLIAERPPSGPHRMRSTSEVVAAFLDAGFAEKEAARLAVFFCQALLALVADEALEVERRRAGLPIRRDVMAEIVLRGDVESTLTPEVASELKTIQPAEIFEIGQQVLLDGIEARRLRRAGAGAPGQDGGSW